MNEVKSFNQWMVDQGFNAIRHANCCRIAYEGGQQSMQAEIDQLKAQLNNMEACYIGKKKQVDGVSQVLCELKESMDGFKEMDLYDKGYRVTTEYVIADLGQALRGEHANPD